MKDTPWGIEGKEKSPPSGGNLTQNLKSLALQACTLPVSYCRYHLFELVVMLVVEWLALTRHDCAALGWLLFSIQSSAKDFSTLCFLFKLLFPPEELWQSKNFVINNFGRDAFFGRN